MADKHIHRFEAACRLFHCPHILMPELMRRERLNRFTASRELWNGDTADPAMNSSTHLMLVGDLGIWLYE